MVVAPLILKGKTDEIRSASNIKFKSLLLEALKEPEAFYYPFDSLKTIARMTPEDNAFHIFNWNFPKTDGTFEYFAVLHQKISEKKKSPETYKVIDFKDHSHLINNPEGNSSGPDNWFGAHYYKLFTLNYKKEKFYFLLGLDWNDLMTNKKVIEVITIQNNGNIKLGSPIFEMGKKTLKRVIFEYSDQAVMSLKFMDEEKRIVFDHLSPSNPALKDQHQYYGPDFSFDAYNWKKGKMIYQQDIDARNSKSIEKGIKYNDPK